jgi:hypothetical protein
VLAFLSMWYNASRAIDESDFLSNVEVWN